MTIQQQVYLLKTGELGLTGSSKKVLCPDLELELTGTTRNPIVKKSNINWRILTQLHKEIIKDNLMTRRVVPISPREGFSGFRDVGPGDLYVSLDKLDEKESSRLLRLMTNQLILSERLRYRVRKRNPTTNRDPYELHDYLGDMYASLSEICERKKASGIQRLF